MTTTTPSTLLAWSSQENNIIRVVELDKKSIQADFRGAQLKKGACGLNFMYNSQNSLSRRLDPGERHPRH
mgnify:FL=1